MSVGNWLKDAAFIEVDAGVRYWEDAYPDGDEDAAGNMPLRVGDRWRPTIELATGRVIDWPEGQTASVHYKVCDDGEYWLLDAGRNRIAKWKGSYVPNSILCIDDNGYGDYIIFTIGSDGLVDEWRSPKIASDDWEPCALRVIQGRDGE